MRNLGGDPEMVTIMGHSSGAMAVSLVTLTKKWKNLFHRAIIMAGPATILDCTDLNKEFAVRAGCATSSSWEAGNEFG